MGEKIKLKLDAREAQGKKVRGLRQQGFIPGIVYGHGMEPLNVQAEAVELQKVVNHAGKHSPVNLTGIEGRIAMIKNVDYDPTRHGVIRHVSFHAVKADEQVHAEVPIHLVGEGDSAAEKAGLIVLQALDKIEIKAFPGDLPEALEVSIVGLAVAGDRVTVGDITLPSGVELVEHVSQHNDDDQDEKPSVTDLVVANVYEPGALQAQNDAAAGDATDESDVESENGTEEVLPVGEDEETKEKE